MTAASRTRFAALLTVAAVACSHAHQSEPAPAAGDLPAVSAAVVDAHLRYLSDDLLEGRAPATRGGRLAAKYIAAQFRAMGLEPAGRDGSYFEPVALVGMVPQARLAWGRQGVPPVTLRYGEDFVGWAEKPEEQVSVDAEVVFVGYGVKAADWQWDDYKGQDLRGKVLLMLVNDPGLQDTTIFLGKVLTYYGRWTYKLEEAARQGAVGALLIHTTESATYGWNVVRGSWTVEQFKLDRTTPQSLAYAGWVTYDATKAALSAAGQDLDALTRAAARRDFRPVATGIRAQGAVTSRVRRVPSENVLARLPGADAGAASEFVLYTAHYDHKGIGVAVNGDSTYNGAEDNASGVAAMLEVARMLTQAPRARRSFVFAAVTAEESGLLGSEAWVADPPLPLARTAAVLNIDGINVRGRTRDIGALGLDRSTIGPMFEAAAAAESLRVSREPDIRGSFFRSDHFPFAKGGVPAISLQDGVEFVGRPVDWGREQDALYDRVRYHQPSDEWSATFDYGGTLQEVRVMARLGLSVANGTEMPRWLATSEFQRPASR